MGKNLNDIAKELKANNAKAQLIYAFNGSGKTRLSLEFKDLFSSDLQLSRKEVLYYNASTEDLFYWNPREDSDIEPKLKVFSNKFINDIAKIISERDIQSTFQRYSSNKLNPILNILDENGEKKLSYIFFSYETGDDRSQEKIKISRGEESCFIWSLFYSLLNEIINTTNTEEANRETNEFNNIQYVFIDDPVSSLDENHLIQLAVDLAVLINKSKKIKFIITTHNTLFYNILYNELGLKNKTNGVTYILRKNDDESFELMKKRGDSNKSFSYHLYLKEILEKIEPNEIEKYHFMLLRNLYEKVANFLGYSKWSDLLPEDSREEYYARVINFSSHSTLSVEVTGELTPAEKQIVKYLLNHLIENYNFGKPNEENN
ncbi:AAA family ATPase [Avibacterium gallinarum]|uniref:AAA family ATPase n=1 Tax=Avibacterium gallinarum TaxID=755 RepID=UPI003BF8EFED